ncbi:hypothetical protein MOP88_06750 [Sphingomonas sp. WKB10]|nr:hypothetical protein [Sphingomonas sp. WKB10]
MIRRTILEWQAIRYGYAADEMPMAAADRIAAVAAASPLAGRDGGGVLEHGRKGCAHEESSASSLRRVVRLKSCPRSTWPAEAISRPRATSANGWSTCWLSRST